MKCGVMYVKICPDDKQSGSWIKYCYIKSITQKSFQLGSNCIVNYIDKKLNKNLVDRWKKRLNFDGNLDNYKSLYDVIKSMRYSYRTLFQFDWFSLRLKSIKSLVYVYS